MVKLGKIAEDKVEKIVQACKDKKPPLKACDMMLGESDISYFSDSNFRKVLRERLEPLGYLVRFGNGSFFGYPQNPAIWYYRKDVAHEFEVSSL